MKEIEAIGESEVERVKVRSGEETREIEVDFVACSALIQPNLRVIGQKLPRIVYFDGLGFIPLHNEYMEADNGLIIAGGVSGSPYGVLHIIEGEIAGLSAVISLGVSDAKQEREMKVREYLKKLQEMKLEAKREVFKSYRSGEIPKKGYSNPPTCYTLKPGRNSFICFCEDITTRDIYETIRRGFDLMENIKRATGVCTGRCQGRLCMVNASLYAAYLLRKNPNEVGLTRHRPPASTIPLSVLAAGGE